MKGSHETGRPNQILCREVHRDSHTCIQSTVTPSADSATTANVAAITPTLYSQPFGRCAKPDSCALTYHTTLHHAANVCSNLLRSKRLYMRQNKGHATVNDCKGSRVSRYIRYLQSTSKPPWHGGPACKPQPVQTETSKNEVKIRRERGAWKLTNVLHRPIQRCNFLLHS